MLVIRKEQTDKMREAAVREFIHALAEYMENRVGRPSDQSRRELPAVIAQAREAGLVRECDVAEFCCLLYLCTGTLDLRKLPKQAQNILLEFGEDPREKLGRLHTWMESYQHSAVQSA